MTLFSAPVFFEKKVDYSLYKEINKLILGEGFLHSRVRENL